MMDLFSQNCPCCDSAKVDVRTRYTTQNNGTHSIYHCRSCDIYFSDTFATPMAGLRTPLSRIIEVLKARTEGQGLNATARIFGVSKKSIIDWEWRLSELKPALTLYGLCHQFLSLVIEGDELSSCTKLIAPGFDCAQPSMVCLQWVERSRNPLKDV